MAALDTNVLVRFIVADDEAQYAAVERLLHRAIADSTALFVPLTVTLELEWVLRSLYGFEKTTVLETFADLLSSIELDFESEAIVAVALALYADGRAAFADCLHAASADHAGEQPLWTFDRTASKLIGARLLSASR